MPNSISTAPIFKRRFAPALVSALLAVGAVMAMAPGTASAATHAGIVDSSASSALASTSGAGSPEIRIATAATDPALLAPAVREARAALLEAGKLASALASPTSVAADYYGYLISDNGRCLDLDHGTGPAILHWTCHGRANQRWKLTRNPSRNQWEIKPASYPTQCADVRGNVGPDIIKYNCKLSANQLWYGVNGTFRSYLNYNKCLDASGTSSKALLWTCNGQSNQLWTLVV
jgi:hypothetical protein